MAFVYTRVLYYNKNVIIQFSIWLLKTAKLTAKREWGISSEHILSVGHNE